MNKDEETNNFEVFLQLVMDCIQAKNLCKSDPVDSIELMNLLSEIKDSMILNIELSSANEDLDNASESEKDMIQTFDALSEKIPKPFNDVEENEKIKKIKLNREALLDKILNQAVTMLDKFGGEILITDLNSIEIITQYIQSETKNFEKINFFSAAFMPCFRNFVLNCNLLLSKISYNGESFSADILNKYKKLRVEMSSPIVKRDLLYNDLLIANEQLNKEFKIFKAEQKLMAEQKLRAIEQYRRAKILSTFIVAVVFLMGAGFYLFKILKK
jgi:hypothetical protein